MYYINIFKGSKLNKSPPSNKKSAFIYLDLTNGFLLYF